MTKLDTLLELSASDLVELLRLEMTNSEVARATGIHKGNVSRIFRGERGGCSEANWRLLARAAISRNLIEA